MARVWFSRKDPARPVRIAYANGSHAVAEKVTFEFAETLFADAGFSELPDGPRLIVEGELSSVVGEVPA
jgi:hypothetical protein